MKEKTDDANEATQKMAQESIDTAKGTLDSHSPSVVFYEIGRDTVQGYINGINSMAEEAGEAEAAPIVSIVFDFNVFCSGVWAFNS